MVLAVGIRLVVITLPFEQAMRIVLSVNCYNVQCNDRTDVSSIIRGVRGIADPPRDPSVVGSSPTTRALAWRRAWKPEITLMEQALYYKPSLLWLKQGLE
ncbi:hypothetical protein PoB_006973800 [Plakobranchus ocellatus]|uniref:Uncharacterized protein n=1 Tax=Plakobranchus ocellatus TaxID=259542 RepID=A0AAV4DG25_9GAST|nr:hypothetical protein PoB_006973800 [Plakobranchus ocellatus]